MKITLVRRFMLTCTAIVALCCIMTGVAIFCMVRTQQAVNELNTYSVPGLFWAARLKAVAKDQRTYILLHLSSTKPDEMKDLESKIEQANADLAEGRRNYPRASQEDSSQLESMAAAQEQWMQDWYKIRDLSRAGKKQEAWAAYNTDLMQATLARRKVEDYLATTSKEQGFNTAAAALSLAQRSIWIVVILALVAVPFSIALALVMARRVSKPLQDLRVAAEQISQGNVAVQVEVAGDEEIEELSRSFNSTIEYLQEMAAVSKRIAAGDFATEVHPRSEEDALGHAFVRMTEGLTSLVKGVRDSALQVASAANQIAESSSGTARDSVEASSAIDDVNSTMHEMSVNFKSVVSNTQAQSSSTSETSASIEQMVASIQRVANTTQMLIDISDRSREEVEVGVLSMEKAHAGLGRINASIQSSAEIIDSLGTRADNVGKIIEVIDDLAEQTNLLALNAAIEAARAGEHGLGFAVVADEVRKLAEKSARSTQEISQLIQSMQKETHNAVQRMAESTSIVNDGMLLGTELRSALDRITSVVAEVNKCAQQIGGATAEQSHGSRQIAEATTTLSQITREISASIEEQSSGTQAVVKAMERMHDIVQRYTSSSAELAASADQMSKMSSNLISMMNNFQLRGDSPSAPLSRASGARETTRSRSASARG